MKIENPPAGKSRRNVLKMAALSGVGLAVSGLVASRSQAAATSGPSTASADPLKSAGAMAFGAGNVLFVGDIAGAAVHAFALRKSDLTPQTGVVYGNAPNFEGRDLVRGVDRKLAAMFGTTYDQIVINDMVVHQPTQQVFLSVERGRGTDALPAIVKVNHGQLEVLDLDGIPHSQVAIPNEPAPTAMLEFGPQRVYAITDIKYHDGEVFVTGVSNQRFASTLYRIPYPFADKLSTTTVEIWHPVHGEWETRAPIIRMLIRADAGGPHLYAVYGCTPLVRFPLSALKDGAHVRGDLIGQLAYGSNPQDMLTFQNPTDQKEYLLVTIDTFSASQIAVAALPDAPAEPTGGPIDFSMGGLGKTQQPRPIRAEHTAILDPNWAVLVWRHPKTAYRLDVSTLIVPYFFERRDGMSEMNWPDGPDPFHYREHRHEETVVR